MKLILSMLIMIGMIQVSATAQSKSNQNFKICRVDGKYVPCDENSPAISTTKRAMKKDTRTITELRKLDSYVAVVTPEATPSPRPVYYSSKQNPRFSVAYEDPNAAYQGEESKINDGVEKNIERNTNYLNSSVQRPPSDGGNSDKK